MRYLSVLGIAIGTYLFLLFLSFIFGLHKSESLSSIKFGILLSPFYLIFIVVTFPFMLIYLFVSKDVDSKISEYGEYLWKRKNYEKRVLRILACYPFVEKGMTEFEVKHLDYKSHLGMPTSTFEVNKEIFNKWVDNNNYTKLVESKKSKYLVNVWYLDKYFNTIYHKRSNVKLYKSQELPLKDRAYVLGIFEKGNSDYILVEKYINLPDNFSETISNMDKRVLEIQKSHYKIRLNKIISNYNRFLRHKNLEMNDITYLRVLDILGTEGLFVNNIDSDRVSYVWYLDKYTNSSYTPKEWNQYNEFNKEYLLGLSDDRIYIECIFNKKGVLIEVTSKNLDKVLSEKIEDLYDDLCRLEYNIYYKKKMVSL